MIPVSFFLFLTTFDSLSPWGFFAEEREVSVRNLELLTRTSPAPYHMRAIRA